MAHIDWCGRSCGECDIPCEADSENACYLDCEHLHGEDERDVSCLDCDAFVDIVYDLGEGGITLTAKQFSDLKELVRITCEQLNITTFTEEIILMNLNKIEID